MVLDIHQIVFHTRRDVQHIMSESHNANRAFLLHPLLDLYATTTPVPKAFEEAPKVA